MSPGRLRSSPAPARHYSALRIPHSAFRSWPAIRQRRAPPPQAGERLRPEVCPAHSAFRTPHSALGFKVDQRIPPLGEAGRSEEHTSELQSQSNLVCRLLLEKKKKKKYTYKQ